jgi:hypothetical protein
MSECSRGYGRLTWMYVKWCNMMLSLGPLRFGRSGGFRFSHSYFVSSLGTIVAEEGVYHHLFWRFYWRIKKNKHKEETK